MLQRILSSAVTRILAKRALPITLFVFAVGYWSLTQKIIAKYPNYMASEASTILKMAPSDFLKPIYIENRSATKNWGDYVIFAPLGFNAVAALDRYVIAPIALGPNAGDPAYFVNASKRLAPLHLFLLGAVTVGCFVFLRRLTGSAPAAVVGAVYLTINHGFSHSLAFVSTFGLYVMLAGAMLALSGLVDVCKTDAPPSRRTLAQIGLGLGLAVLSHGQSGALPIVLMAFTTAAILLWRVPVKRLAIAGYGLPLAALAAFLAMHMGHGLRETGAVTESQYMFSYPSLLVMIEEMVVNASFHIANTIDGLLLPWPMLSVAVMGKVNMTLHNTYNAVYAQYPNMHYRMLGLWYVGFLFAVALYGTAKALRRILARNRGTPELVGLAGVGLLWGGFVMHIPVMFRDYFLIPGYDVGYKATLAHLGLAVVLAWAASDCLLPRLQTWTMKQRYGVILGICAWIGVGNFCKTILNLGYTFPW